VFTQDLHQAIQEQRRHGVQTVGIGEAEGRGEELSAPDASTEREDAGLASQPSNQPFEI